MNPKGAVYSAAKQLGMFRLTRATLGGGAVILAYHGFEITDETQFRPKLFIRASTFRRHLQILKDRGFNVISLGTLVAGITKRDLPPRSVAITVDDGFATTLTVAAPILAEFAFPATVYATTYYMLKQAPVFDLCAGYLLWKGSQRMASVSNLDPEVNGTWKLGTPGDRAALQQRLLEFGRRARSEEDRQRLCRALAAAVGFDYEAIVRAGAFRLMSFDEARKLAQFGVEIELHTHRHTFPASTKETCQREIEDNRRWIEGEIGGRPEHFCYPSGEFAPQHAEWLRELGVRSAVTCEAGFARKGDSPYFLNRFLDGEMVSDLEFEAELFGFAAVVRRLSGRRTSTADRR